MSTSAQSNVVKSMTGFARVSGSLPAVDVDVEVKSVNSRYLEVAVKGSTRFSSLEREVKPIFQKSHNRGRIDVLISRRVSVTRSAVCINQDKFDASVSSYISVCKRYGAGTTGLPQFIASLVLREGGDTVEEAELSDAELQLIRDLLGRASEMLAEARAVEGAALISDIIPRVQKLWGISSSVREQMSGAAARVKDRLLGRLNQVAPEILVDKERLALEVALLADRVDVSEELARLGIHLDQFLTCVQNEAGQGIGRKLDFLTQEIARELNTIGSKAQDGMVQGLVVEAKAELEKIREQVQNIE